METFRRSDVGKEGLRRVTVMGVLAKTESGADYVHNEVSYC